MAVPHTCSPAMLLPHQNRHNLEILTTLSGHRSHSTIAYRLIRIRLFPSNGLPRSTIDIHPHLLPDPPLLDSGPHTRAPSPDDRHSNRMQKSDSAKDVLFARFGRCSIAHTFRVPAATVLPTNLLDLGSLLNAHDCSSCTIPAGA